MWPPPWLVALLVSLSGPIRRALDAIGQWVSGLVGTIHRVLGGIRIAWNLLYSRARGGVAALGHALSELYSTAWWIIHVWAPRQFLYWNNRISRWVLDGIHKLDRLARGLVAALERWVRDRLNGLWDTLGKVRQWFLDRIHEIWATLVRVRDIVFGLLTSPARLAEWVIAAIVAALWRYAFRQRDRIASWFLRTSPAFTLWLARTLDDIIGRIL